MQLLRKRYDKFAGADFSTDAASISASHASDMRNMIADSGGCPEKRVGYKTVLSLESQINGIFKLGDKYVIHAGDKMYVWDGESEPLVSLEGVNDAKSTALEFRKKLYILTGKDFLVFDGEKVIHVHDEAFIPSVTMYGETYQPFNLLTGKRKEGVTIDKKDEEIVYKVDIVEDSVVLYYSDGKKEVSRDNYIVNYHLDSEYYDNYQKFFTIEMKVLLTNSPNEYILEYEVENEKTKKNRAMIEECTFMAVYENRLFLGGNPAYPSVDFHCELNDPSYFTDISYTSIGTAEEKPNEDEEKARDEEAKAAEILGYSHIDNYLAVHKDNSSGGASIYLRSSTLTEEEIIFPINEGISGESLISHHTIGALIDDPLFATKSGVYAIGSADVTHKRSILPRSSRINSRLAKENLSEAVSCIYDGYYMLFTGGNVYVADSRQKSYARNYSNDFEYEWYFWDNIPARCVHSDEFLWFGTEDGRICRFMTELKGAPEAYNDDGAPIVAEWTTKMDDFGSFETKKNIRRRGSGVYVKTYECPHQAEIVVVSERDFGNVVATRGIFNFENLDFSRFTLSTTPYSFVDFNFKIKNFRMAQVKCRNDKLNEPFGVVAIELTYQTGDFAK